VAIDPNSKWFALMTDCGIVKFSDLIRWLQSEHKLGYTDAHKLTHKFLEWREKNAPKVRYASEGRSGNVHYISSEATFDFWYEFAGGNALAIVDIPTEQQWTARTGTPVARRLRILNFIGEQIVRDQTSGDGSFKIDDNCLTIYPSRHR